MRVAFPVKTLVVLSSFFTIVVNTSTDDVESRTDEVTEDNNSSILANNISEEIHEININTSNSTIAQLNTTAALDVALSSPKNDSKKVAKCKKFVESTADDQNAEVQIVEMVNAVRLAKLLMSDPAITNKDMEGDCMAVLFFAKVCQFSCQAAPQFNALARAFPDVKMIAMDALKYHGINSQYGIVGVPTLKLFHNGKPIGKYNGTEYTLEGFIKFIRMYTNLNEEFTIVMPKDFDGPVPSVMEKELDYFLVMSWLFIIVCGIYFFGKSSWWKKIVETVQNNWRESEAQHEHVD